MRTTIWPGLLAAVSLALACSGDFGGSYGGDHGREIALRQPLARRANVVFILIDTLRGDHVGAYGYSRDTTPNLDRLAKKSVLFERVMAQSSWTHPSLISLFTSKYPSQFVETYVPPGTRRRAKKTALGDEAVTLAEALGTAGYHTASVSTNPYTHESLNVMQGFAEQHLKSRAPASWVVDQAVEMLERHQTRGANAKDGPPAEPFFLYLHFLDMHMPLTPPEEFARLFLDDEVFTPEEHRQAARYIISDDIRDEPDRVDSARARSVALYDASLRFVDSELARLLTAIADRGLENNTVIVVASDHGEMQWDHVALEAELALRSDEDFTGVGHGHALFPELLRVPLIVHIPGALPARISTQVRNVDIAPTLLATLGIAHPGFDAEGIDLLSAHLESKLVDLPAISETTYEAGHQISYSDARRQFMRVRDRELLFAVDRDPYLDLATSEPIQLDSLRARVDRIFSSFERAGGRLPLAVPEVEESLRTLGYVE